jgi:hypothetical protein
VIVGVLFMSALAEIDTGGEYGSVIVSGHSGDEGSGRIELEVEGQG